ncbi:hypothetical protein N9741_03630 [Octadecabacter sp.]|nr:hypothetical protein [Octadecabacter sp.]
MKTLIAAVALALTMSTASQANELDALLINLDGSEVSFTGEIGYNRGSISGGPQLYIKTDAMSSFISGDAALNREQLASIQDCELRATRCTADIKAELTFSTGRPHAIIFEVTNVRPID